MDLDPSKFTKLLGQLESEGAQPPPLLDEAEDDTPVRQPRMRAHVKPLARAPSSLPEQPRMEEIAGNRDISSETGWAIVLGCVIGAAVVYFAVSVSDVKDAVAPAPAVRPRL